MCTFTTGSPLETQKLGYEIGQLSEPSDLILLTGELGAGKTCLTQGICRGAGFEGFASSPSFVLIREYAGRIPIYHIDLYRLDDIEEVIELGLEDYINGDGLCVIEWADKAQTYFPSDHMRIDIEHISQDERSFKLSATGERYVQLVEQITSKWNLLSIHQQI